MTLPLWRADFPQAPLREGYRGLAHQPDRRTPMERGNSRLRALWPGSPAEVETRWRFTAAAFNGFKLFYEGELARGTNWFTLPLWFGGPCRDAEAQFTGLYGFAPRGAHAVTVSARLQVRRMPYEAPAPGEMEGFFDAAGRAVWPASLPEGPLREGIDIEPHRPVPTSDFEEGPRAKRDLFGASPAGLPVQWSMSAAQFESFKTFYFEGLSWGRRRFLAPLWYGRNLDRAALRFLEPFAFAPRFGSRVLVSARVEALRLPVFGPPAFWGVPPDGLAGTSLPGAQIEIEIATAP
ncbi:hypothetical protein [Hoeflea sp.]|uniref:hypothetical protein n=1 Tax=Hoeflea sp. TaxID=1940281 RepID=UPI0019B2A3E6|nr:hypothetical protein [Hoeflea sp.]MBC7282677.1 hypothetical protein [Hoeflea sp.]